MQEMQEMHFQTPGQENPLEQETAAHSGILAWEIPWTEKPSEQQSMRLQKAGQN